MKLFVGIVTRKIWLYNNIPTMCDAKMSEMVNSPFKFPLENLTDITDKRKKKEKKKKTSKQTKNIEKYLSDCCLILTDSFWRKNSFVLRILSKLPL